MHIKLRENLVFYGFPLEKCHNCLTDGQKLMKKREDRIYSVRTQLLESRLEFLMLRSPSIILRFADVIHIHSYLLIVNCFSWQEAVLTPLRYHRRLHSPLLTLSQD